MKKVAIGCDPNATELKETIIKHLKDLGFEAEDYGSEDPIYANVAIKVAEAVAAGKHERGILLCGTGIGVCIAANKVPGAYAALCSDPYSTERSRKSNNANIMTMGSQVTGPELAKSLVTIWMNSEYTPGGRSEPKVQRITEYAKEHQK
jgi:ribose 5-phosphate isomerase B